MNSAVQQAIDDLLVRIRGEYLEMPGLQLTEAQAQRLWSLDKAMCRLLLTRLLRVRFLALTRDGRYRRADGIVAGNTQQGPPTPSNRIGPDDRPALQLTLGAQR